MFSMIMFIFIILGIFFHDTIFIIAAGLFAIAGAIELVSYNLKQLCVGLDLNIAFKNLFKK